MTSDLTPARQRRSNRFAAAALACIAAGLLGACGSGAQHATSTTSSTERSTAPATRAVLAGSPSPTTKMICGREVQDELRATLGVSTTRPVVATWRNGIYACRYTYRDGTVTLAVRQLAGTAAAEHYFDTLATRLGPTQRLTGLGQRAAATAHGTVLVQKDEDVLSVDPRGLPPRFGNRHDTPADVALSIAATVMGCWTES